MEFKAGDRVFINPNPVKSYSSISATFPKTCMAGTVGIVYKVNDNSGSVEVSGYYFAPEDLTLIPDDFSIMDLQVGDKVATKTPDDKIIRVFTGYVDEYDKAEIIKFTKDSFDELSWIIMDDIKAVYRGYPSSDLTLPPDEKNLIWKCSEAPDKQASIEDVYKDIEAAQIILAGAEAKLKKLEKGDR